VRYVLQDDASSREGVRRTVPFDATNQIAGAVRTAQTGFLTHFVARDGTCLAGKEAKRFDRKHGVDTLRIDTAPPGKRMGHAGAIVSGSAGTAAAKISAMQDCGIHVCRELGRLGEFCAGVFTG